MRIRVLLLAAALVSPAAANGAAAQADSTRIYGRITTVDGERYEGYIRWDKNEASWADILDATKEIRPARRSGKAVLEQGRVGVFGVPVGWRRHVRSARASRSAQSGIRFGHILTLEPRGDGARLVLVSGREIELESGGDLGDAVRGIVIQDPRSQVELGWDDVRRIEFLTAPEAASRPSAERLYGRLETRGGQRFTGYVAWDMDEVLTSDVLDGERRGRTRKIPFGAIRSIERDGSGSARVALQNGDEMVLGDSNDVDEGNRGIVITDAAFGQAKVEWDAFRRLTFETPPAALAAPRFDGGSRLRGTVHTRSGRQYSGLLRWDDDEEYTWEMLNGNPEEGVELQLEFGQLRHIERVSDSAARVELRDGRRFELEGSNDVDSGNKGIFVRLTGGRLVSVEWQELQRVEFRD